MSAEKACKVCGYTYLNESDEEWYGHKHAAHPDPDIDPDWSSECLNCNQSPIVPVTGMCGPCTFGEAETAGGMW